MPPATGEPLRGTARATAAARPALTALRAGRAASIDAFRGITFLVMIFVNELGGVSGITPWLKHMPADADAMSVPDIVFPAFLFIVGMAIPFAINSRLKQGDSRFGLQRHIFVRALALVVMGVFMVNAEGGFNARAMPISIQLWSLCFYAAVLLVWGVYRLESVVLDRALHGVGVAILIALALVFRGGVDGSRGMTPQWWGILGLIGWAYLICCVLYQLSAGRMAALLAMLAGCVAYYAASHAPGLHAALGWLFSQDAHAAHSSIVLCGVVCALIFFDAQRPDSNRRRFGEAALFLVALALAAYLLRPIFKISKIYATPSWCLYSSAICIALFALLYWLIDVRHRDRWTRLVEPAASNPLVTYLIPFVVEASLLWLGLALPDALQHGAMGLAWSAIYAAAVVWLVSRLNRVNFRLGI